MATKKKKAGSDSDNAQGCSASDISGPASLDDDWTDEIFEDDEVCLPPAEVPTVPTAEPLPLSRVAAKHRKFHKI